MAVNKMDRQKSAYIGGIFILALTLIIKWNAFSDEQAKRIAASDPSIIQGAADTPGHTAIPSAPATPTAGEIPAPPAEQPTASQQQLTDKSQHIHITTDTLDLYIDKQGGDIVKVVLPQHKVTLNEEQGFTLLDITQSTTYIAQSGLIGPNGTDSAEGNRPLFRSDKQQYTMEQGQNTLHVDLQLQQGEVSITKRFTFTRGDYLIKLSYLVNNPTNNDWQAYLYGQIKRDNHQPPSAADSGLGVTPYYGAATTTHEDNYKKITFSELDSQSESFNHPGGWVAMVQHYFVGAWVPNQNDNNQFFLKKLKQQNQYLMGFTGPQTVIPAGTQGELNTQFYIGPKDIDRLEVIADYLDLTVDYGFLWWIAKPLFQLLDFIHTYTGNWGWAIIVLTLIIKTVFFYLSAVSYRSMAKMRKVGPKMQALKDRFGDDRQKMSQEMMKLYKKEKVNPMSGCLPLLIQMPVFIALYWALMESVELRHAPFILWINDLSVMDPYFIFPLLMGATMFIQQQLNPTPPDPMQAKIMKWMPVAFTFLFLWFPAGLVIYWVTNNILSIIQQYLITRAIDAEGQ